MRVINGFIERFKAVTARIKQFAFEKRQMQIQVEERFQNLLEQSEKVQLIKKVTE